MIEFQWQESVCCFQVQYRDAGICLHDGLRCLKHTHRIGIAAHKVAFIQVFRNLHSTFHCSRIQAHPSAVGQGLFILLAHAHQHLLLLFSRPQSLCLECSRVLLVLICVSLMPLRTIYSSPPHFCFFVQTWFPGFVFYIPSSLLPFRIFSNQDHANCRRGFCLSSVSYVLFQGRGLHDFDWSFKFF